MAKRADRKEIKKLETEKAQLVAQVVAMTQELGQKSEEIQKYNGEQGSGLQPDPGIGRTSGRGHQQGTPLRPFDGICGSVFRPEDAPDPREVLTNDEGSVEGDPEGRTPSSIPRRVLYPGPPGSPTGTLYEVIGEVELVPPSQAEPPSRRNPEGFRTERDPVFQNGPTLPLCTGRALGRSGPEEVSHLLRGGRRIGPEL